MTSNKGSIHTSMEGFYKVYVVNAETNAIVWEQPDFKKNLILNQGMDAIAARSFQACMQYAWAGSGTRFNSISGNGTGISQTGTTITMDQSGGLTHFTQSAGGYLIALAAGDVIQYLSASGGTDAVTVASVSDITCVVNVSQTVTSSLPFTIWKTSQIGLQGPNFRTAGNNVTQTGPSGSYWLENFCGSTISASTIRLFRTYDFGTEAGAQTFSEIGVGWDRESYKFNTIFSRILLDSPVTINPGQRLRVAYELFVTVSPAGPTFRTNVPITNWPVAPSTNTNGTESIQIFNDTIGIEGIISTGAGKAGDVGGVLDPFSANGSQCNAFISTTSTALANFSSSVDRSGNAEIATVSLASYSGVGSYFIDKTCILSLTQINQNNIRSFGLGNGPGGAFQPAPYLAATQVYAFLFEQNQTKTNVQTLSLAWRYTWGRTLTNGSA